MENEFIPHEQALALKELGFNEPCFATFYKKKLSQYPNSREEETGFNATPFEVVKNSEVAGLIADTISAPLYQQAFRWFREKKSLCSWVYQSNSGLYHYSILKDDRYLSSSYNNETTYKEAELACLKKLIEIIKKK